MHTEASGPNGEAAPARVERCAQCKEIKAKRHIAVQQGDQRMAEAMATAMGRHQRAVHS